ncbi:MAG TPA: TetR/AcrR family transcriptional regulator [Caulobacteraceae bacterium]
MALEDGTLSARKGDAMRARIVEAAERIVAGQGVVALTTRALAQGAACAEGTLYVHFPDRLAIISAIFERHWPQATEALDQLQTQVGAGRVVDNLCATLERIRDFLVALDPIMAGVMADPTLCHTLQGRWCELGVGPQAVAVRLAAYIARERAIGRVAAKVDPDAASEALLGFLFYSKAATRFWPDRPQHLTEARLHWVVETLVGDGGDA